ncbi:hypothetical protein [Pararhizobium sp. DWP1-1-3]|uniref:hypothetical protein n=1 Tax=Pararhizobium sp. DWP1-1-3 TaxID=2804652 RepID=UPI003CF3759E
MSAPRLSPDTKQAILDAYLAGDKITVIASKFGVDPSYPRILFRRHCIAEDTKFLKPKSERASA